MSHQQQYCWRKTSTPCKANYSRICQIFFNNRLIKGLLFVFLVRNPQQCCREHSSGRARLLLNNRREAIKCGNGKSEEKFSTFEILFTSILGVAAILWRACFLDWFGQDHEDGDPGLLNRMIWISYKMENGIEKDCSILLSPFFMILKLSCGLW